MSDHGDDLEEKQDAENADEEHAHGLQQVLLAVSDDLDHQLVTHLKQHNFNTHDGDIIGTREVMEVGKWESCHQERRKSIMDRPHGTEQKNAVIRSL
jgi:hypothetical protein